MGLPLEDFFDIHPPAQTNIPMPTPDMKGYDEGLADGRAQAEAEFEAERNATLQAVGQSLSDLTIGYADARAAVLEQLGPLFQSVINVLLPELTQLSFREQLVQLLRDAAAQDAASPVTLRIGTQLDEDIPAFLDAQGLTDIVLKHDPSLQPGQALLTSEQDETMLDLERAKEEIERAFQSLTDTENRKRING